jgi:hypothetical protein
MSGCPICLLCSTGKEEKFDESLRRDSALNTESLQCPGCHAFGLLKESFKLLCTCVSDTLCYTVRVCVCVLHVTSEQKGLRP